jgi:hypothetical protein
MTNVLQVLIVLTGIVGFLVLFVGLAYCVGWAVGLGFRSVPLAGRHKRVGREPIRTHGAAGNERR